MVVVLAGLAEMERDTISERTKDALEARCRSIGIKAGRPKYGYFYVDDLVCIDEIKAAIVRRVYALREQKLPLRAIADRIEQETGKHIGFKTVKEILDNENVYRGGKRGESEQTWPVILA